MRIVLVISWAVILLLSALIGLQALLFVPWGAGSLAVAATSSSSVIAAFWFGFVLGEIKNEHEESEQPQ